MIGNFLLAFGLWALVLNFAMFLAGREEIFMKHQMVQRGTILNTLVFLAAAVAHYL